MVATLAANLGKGLAAGLIGTIAMTISSTTEMHLRGRPGSAAPATAASKVLGIATFTSAEAEARFSSLVHWAYGTGWGAVRGLVGTVLSPRTADVAHVGAVYGTEHLMLPALEVAPPATEWGANEIAIDGLHHLVYAAATSLAYRWLDARAPFPSAP